MAADRIFVNPPYGDGMKLWVRRCLEVGQAGRQVVLLMPAATDTKLGQAILHGAERVLFLAGRLDFGAARPNGLPFRAHFASMLACWGVSVAPFLSGVELAPLGAGSDRSGDATVTGLPHL